MKHAPFKARAVARFAAAGLGLASLTAYAQISGDVVRIGVMADQAGPYATELGPGGVMAARMAVEDFGGKVAGKPIEILVGDDQNKPDVGLGIARKWLDTDGVDAIVGGSTTAIALAVNSLMRDRSKPYLIAGTGSSDLTGKACSPMTLQFVYDTYALPKAGVATLSAQGIKSWYFITVDYAFGHQMQADATRFIEQSGGKVLGSVKHPFGTADFSSYLLQAQASGAQAIVFLSAGTDIVNGLKQAREFGLNDGKRTLTAFGITVNSVAAAGLEATQGIQFVDPFYWNVDEDGRAWSKRFMARFNGRAPTYTMAGTYSAVLHYLKGVQAANSDDGSAAMAKMRATPINDFSMKNIQIREDGQVMRPMYAVEVKKPSESNSKWDLYKVKGTVSPEQVWRPLGEGSCPSVGKKS